MTQDLDRCFFVHRFSKTALFFKEICAEIDWVEKGSVPITKTFDDIQQYQKLAMTRLVTVDLTQ